MKERTRIVLKVAVFVVVGIFSLQTGALESQGVETDIFEMTAPVQTDMRPIPGGSAWPDESPLIKHPKGSDRLIYWTPSCYDLE
jgi:hypothetical protein